MLRKRTLILGGSRSGKSCFAERRAAACGQAVVYIATAPHIPGDDEWNQRIAEHRKRRPAHWQTVEAPLQLVPALAAVAGDSSVLLVDCLSLWLSNLLYHEHDVAQAQQEFCTWLQDYKGTMLLVSNEVGMGLVPESAPARRFRDAQGRLNQAVAAIVDDVLFIAAGLPLCLKSGGCSRLDHLAN